MEKIEQYSGRIQLKLSMESRGYEKLKISFIQQQNTYTLIGYRFSFVTGAVLDELSGENGCKDFAASSNALVPKHILRLCKSEMCARHLMAIWTGQFSCARHSNYEPPPLPPLQFELNIGDFLSEFDAISLVEHLDAVVSKFKDATKSSLRRLHYVTTVALPEAIIFAITQVSDTLTIKQQHRFKRKRMMAVLP
ncbi:unnamed protein product [Gongylonema pulchrum]|uniref:Uncharacterized protein n=1 Tax=Gongylonema pulchrum TaxID=637853 RepID=A0A183EV44_9BILA|nr:unnamed protein product [Gongylonema pulchrum]